jgi:exodeoxyribonuclease-3
MKITTWNVNGLRAILEKDAWSWVRSYQPEVLCLQEIKTRPDQLKPAVMQWFSDYHICWNPAARPGYSGVATFSKEAPVEHNCQLGREDFDREGRLIWQRVADYLLFNVYFPNGQRDQGRLDYKLGFYACLLELCNHLHKAGERIIITGDFNTAHNEIDLRNPKSNQNTSGFLAEERLWIDRYLSEGFLDAYRVIYPERVQYTWWTYITNARERNVGWRLDYFLVSNTLMPRVKDVIIHDDVLGSDHCPVTLIIDE